MAKPVNIKTEVLNDLASRFLINIPDEDKDDPIKLCSHIEVAHWFYLDLVRPEDPSLPACSMREFMATIFKHCPFLVRDSTASNLDGLIAQWKSHKYKKPVRGAIILNQDWTKCLLVQGYPASTSWGFPKGKLEKGEKDLDAAVREVYEETGFDSRSIIREDWYLDAKVNDCDSRMYIIPGVPEETQFGAKTRKEIRAIEWFPIDNLPKHKKDLTSKQTLGKSANNFFMVIPFMGQLRKWLTTHQKTTTRTHKNKTISASFQNPVQSRSEIPSRHNQHQTQSLLAQPAYSRPPILPTPSQSHSGIQIQQNQYQSHGMPMSSRSPILPTPIQAIPAGTPNRFPVTPPQVIQSHPQVQNQFHQPENQFQTQTIANRSRLPILPTPSGVLAVNPTPVYPSPHSMTMPQSHSHVQYQQYGLGGMGYGNTGMYPNQGNPAAYRSLSDPRQSANISGLPPNVLMPVSRSNTAPIPNPPPHPHTPHTQHTIPAPLQQLSAPYITTVYPTHLAYGNTHRNASYYQQTTRAMDHGYANNFNPSSTISSVNVGPPPSDILSRDSQKTATTAGGSIFLKPSLNFQNFTFDTNAILSNSVLRT